jgi:hypothetical protein
MSANAQPGQTVEVVWNFINLRGDRPTHIAISKSSGPNWEVDYDPKLETKMYDVAGIETESLENFAVSKSEIVLEKPDPLPEGKVAYVVHPDSTQGYILVDEQLKIFIEVDDNAKVGETQEFVFEAIGSCFGETGAVSANLATELKVRVTPLLEYYEKPLDEEGESKDLDRNILNIFGDSSKINPVAVILGGFSLILIIALIFLLDAVKKSKKGRKK